MNDQCQYKKDNGSICGTTFGLTQIYFRNQIIKSENIEIALCQFHSDQILRLMLEKYNECIIIEEKAFGEAKLKGQLAKKYERVVEPINYQKLSNVRKLKNKILHSVCRNIYCGKQLNFKNVYTATAYHTNGKFRHCFYFCSWDCWIGFKRMCGYRPTVPIQQKQISRFA